MRSKRTRERWGANIESTSSQPQAGVCLARSIAATAAGARRTPDRYHAADGADLPLADRLRIQPRRAVARADLLRCENCRSRKWALLPIPSPHRLSSAAATDRPIDATITVDAWIGSSAIYRWHKQVSLSNVEEARRRMLVHPPASRRQTEEDSPTPCPEIFPQHRQKQHRRSSRTERWMQKGP
jgi:hypothetical protein